MDNKRENEIRLEEADWYFRKMVRRFVKERDKVTIEGVTLPGLLILHKLVKEGEQRLGDLAEDLDLTSGAITAVCDKLEELGFAVRIRRKEDRRMVVLDITDKGREMFHRNRCIGHRCISALFGGFNEQELVDQIGFYKRIIDNLETFSDTILKLAEENKNKANEQEAKTKANQTVDRSSGGGGHFLTY